MTTEAQIQDPAAEQPLPLDVEPTPGLSLSELLAAEQLPEPLSGVAGAATSGEPTEADAMLSQLANADDIMRLSGQIPAAPTGQSATAATVTPPADDPTEDGAASLAEGKGLPDRLRTRGLNPAQRAAMEMILQHPDKSLEELARGSQGRAVSAAPGEPAFGDHITQPKPEVDFSSLQPPAETAASIQAQIAGLRTQRNAATRKMQMDEVATLNEQIDALRDRVPQAERAEREYARAGRAAFQASFNRAAATYPEMVQENSPLAREISRLEKQAERTRDPVFDHPNKAMILASMAAGNLGVSPRARAAGTAAASAQPAARPAPVAALTPRAAAPGPAGIGPASGGARTAPTAGVADQTDKLLASVHDCNEMMNLTRQLGIR